jgi:hypothetical protein
MAKPLPEKLNPASGRKVYARDSASPKEGGQEEDRQDKEEEGLGAFL